VLSGTGTLRTEKAGNIPLSKGATFVVPHAAGESTVDGDVTAIRCLPPVS
jgi:mannose-6-phosphate isomerase